jgi:hypothetical protein
VGQSGSQDSGTGGGTGENSTVPEHDTPESRADDTTPSAAPEIMETVHNTIEDNIDGEQLILKIIVIIIPGHIHGGLLKIIKDTDLSYIVIMNVICAGVSSEGEKGLSVEVEEEEGREAEATEGGSSTSSMSTGLTVARGAATARRSARISGRNRARAAPTPIVWHQEPQVSMVPIRGNGSP